MRWRPVKEKRLVHYRSHWLGVCGPGNRTAKTALPHCAPCSQCLGPGGQHRKPVDDGGVAGEGEIVHISPTVDDGV
jgi:hypothetical protein